MAAKQSGPESEALQLVASVPLRLTALALAVPSPWTFSSIMLSAFLPLSVHPDLHPVLCHQEGLL